MTQIGESEQALRRQASYTWAISALAIIATGAWALLPPPTAAMPARAVASGLSSQSAGATFDAVTWQVALWRPLTDAPPPPPKAVPLTLKVFSILRQADGITAAIDPGAGAGLIYARPGQRVGEYLVTAVDERGIEIEANGRRQRVELRP